MIDETHDDRLASWVPGAAGSDFPVQNLPFGCFVRPGDSAIRIGVAIGGRVLDLYEAVDAGALADTDDVLRGPSLNGLMACGPSAWRALRGRLSRLLREGGDDAARGAADRLLVPMDQVAMQIPAVVGDFTDFFASIHHATNAGSLFRPDNPLLPNYKYVPVGYHGRVSSIVPSGVPVRRPKGQVLAPGATVPTLRPSAMLDYEAELGLFMGAGNALGEPIPIGAAAGHCFGLVLLNDWSARDIQAWEYQPLGPFLAKNFATSISPWVVTLDALAPFRGPSTPRPGGDPPPLPHLDDEKDRSQGGLDVRMEVLLCSAAMRHASVAPMRLSQATFLDSYWTLAQMLAHHTSGGCNMRPGDLVGSGTISGPGPGTLGSLLEITRRGATPLALPGGEQRRFLEDGDEVVLRGRCCRKGFTDIGFGECRAILQPAIP